jgi:hypothetical protein
LFEMLTNCASGRHTWWVLSGKEQAKTDLVACHLRSRSSAR